MPLPEIHVLPLNDLRPHEEEGIACPCRPVVETFEGCLLVIHRAWDGREIAEIGRALAEAFRN